MPDEDKFVALRTAFAGKQCPAIFAGPAMKRLIALAMALALPAASPAVAAPWQLSGSDVVSLSAPDGHNYQIMIAWPEGAPPATGWPVLWMLDGADNFATAALTARRLSRVSERSGVGPGVIVAIDSGPLARRVLDYTPHVPGYRIPEGAPASGLPIGGADAFLGFIAKQARPYVAQRLKIDPARETLMGHSLGGLVALHALASGAEFSRYVAISPSLWYGNGALAQSIARAPLTAGRQLLIAHGDREGGPSGGDSAETIVTALKRHGVDARHSVLAGQTHGSTMLASMAQGVTIAFATEAKP